jgi:hypothetical protein
MEERMISKGGQQEAKKGYSWAGKKSQWLLMYLKHGGVTSL